MEFNWNFYIHAGILSLSLILATVIRSRIRFFQKFLIPNPIIAGFILLPFYNFLLPNIGINQEYLGQFAYHLLSISFIALTLREPVRQEGRGRNITATSMAILSQFGIQALIGLLLTWVAIQTFMPELFHSFGLLFPLGFAQGPGQAFAIGEAWKVFGIEDGGTVGLTFAAIGFVVASFGGIFLINYGVRHKWISTEYLNTLKMHDIRTGILPKGTDLPVGAYQTTQTEAIDTLTLNAGIVLATYFLTYLLLKGLGLVLGLAGNLGAELATNFWGISFIFAALTGMTVRKIISALGGSHVLENRTLNRLSGISVDFMVTSSIAAISLVVAIRYWMPILLVVIVGTAVVSLIIPWMASRVFTDHRFLRTLLVFGVSTGTLSTGLALLRILDPDFETPVASDYTYASGITFVFAIPFILSINFSAKAYQTGDMRWFLAALAVAAAYIVATGIWYLFLSGKQAFANSKSVWLDKE